MEGKLREFLLIVIGLIVLVAVIGIIASIVLRPSNFVASNGFYGMMGGYSYGAWYILMPVMAAISVIAFIFMFFFILKAFETHTAPQMQPSGKSSAIDILNERFARGEITENEYRKMREDLK